MAVDPVVQDFIARSMAENNRSLMSEISTLITNSVESIKRSNSEAVEDQLREIKKIRREEPKSFKRKGNEVQYKFMPKSKTLLTRSSRTSSPTLSTKPKSP